MKYGDALEVGRLYGAIVHRWWPAFGVAALRIVDTGIVVCAPIWALQDKSRLRPGDRVVFELAKRVNHRGCWRYCAVNVVTRVPDLDPGEFPIPARVM